jgi:hypothetical protein
MAIWSALTKSKQSIAHLAVLAYPLTSIHGNPLKQFILVNVGLIQHKDTVGIHSEFTREL